MYFILSGPNSHQGGVLAACSRHDTAVIRAGKANLKSKPKEMGGFRVEGHGGSDGIKVPTERWRSPPFLCWVVSLISIDGPRFVRGSAQP